MVASQSSARVEWVLLAYRVPREPSTPRIAVWRKLKRLGVAQIGDGLVAMPADARTTEALDWVAGDIAEAGGTATLWEARLPSRAAEQALVADLAAARAAEYEAIAVKAGAAAREDSVSPVEGMRRLRLLRRELRQVQRRDFFPPPARQRAQSAVKALAETLHAARPEPDLERRVGSR
jgi:uncharacterized protein YdbL (DUF1318 family)